MLWHTVFSVKGVIEFHQKIMPHISIGQIELMPTFFPYASWYVPKKLHKSTCTMAACKILIKLTQDFVSTHATGNTSYPKIRPSLLSPKKTDRVARNFYQKT